MDVLNTVTILLLLVIGCVTCMSIKYKTCGTDPQHINNVDITPCDQQPCEFKHGINVTVKVNFIAAEGSNTSEAEIFGIIAGIPVKFNMPNPNGCSQSGLVCPLKPSMEYTYTSQFLVLKSYPNIRLAVQWDLKAEDGKYLFCFLFPMEIVT